ncbi:PepSY domain-containing protein [Tsukamurella serpentis]
MTLTDTPQHEPAKAPAPPPRRLPPVLTQVQALVARVHFYAGMFIAPFILIAAVTGGLYAMTPAIESVVYRSALTVPASAQHIPLQEQVNVAQRAHTDLKITQVWPSDDPTQPTRVLFKDPAIGGKAERAVFVDPGNGAIVGDLASYSGPGELPFRKWVSGLHKDLNLGKYGAIYSELAASWLWLLTVGGLFLWWRTTRNRKKPKNRSALPRMLAGLPARRGTRLRAMNIHAVVGTLAALALVGLSVTGITWSETAGKNVKWIQSEMNWKATPISTAVPGGADASAALADPATQVSRVLETARAEGLTGPLRLYPPAKAGQGWKASERWVTGRTTSDQISVDGATGTVLDRQDFADLPTFSKLSSWGIYLHMGTMFGLPLQLALLAAALAIIGMVIMGYRMWWKRRPTRGGVGTALGSWKHVGWRVRIAALLIAIPVGWMLPYLAISLALFLVVDVVIQVIKTRRTPAVSG